MTVFAIMTLAVVAFAIVTFAGMTIGMKGMK